MRHLIEEEISRTTSTTRESRLETSQVELKTAEEAMTKTKTSLETKQSQLQKVSEEYQHLEENLKIQLDTTRDAYFEDVNRLASVKDQIYCD